MCASIWSKYSLKVETAIQEQRSGSILSQEGETLASIVAVRYAVELAQAWLRTQTLR